MNAEYFQNPKIRIGYQGKDRKGHDRKCPSGKRAVVYFVNIAKKL